MKDTIKIFELFSGVGAASRALSIGKEHDEKTEIVGINEIDKHAIKAFNKLHGPVKNYCGDIKNIKGEDLKELEIDIMSYGFPCTDLSNQGKQEGLIEGKNSALVWEVLRILKELKELNKLPKVLLMENVKALINKKNIDNFNVFIEVLSELGYKSEYKLLNSIDFGSPQNRERVYMISALTEKKLDIDWNAGTRYRVSNISDILNEENDIAQNALYNNLKDYTEGFYDLKNWKNVNGKQQFKMNGFSSFNSENYIYNANFKGPTLTASGANSRIKLFIETYGIRLMTPLESVKYMGFQTIDYFKLKAIGISDTQIRKLMGNSIEVNTLTYVMRNLLKVLRGLKNDK